MNNLYLIIQRKSGSCGLYKAEGDKWTWCGNFMCRGLAEAALASLIA
jgi:hypothetical protein